MPVSVPYILMIGCFDTKGEIFSFLRNKLLSCGQRVMAINTGVLGSTDLFPVDIEAELVAKEGGYTLSELRAKSDRGYAVDVMGKGVAKIVASLVSKGGLKAAIGMGGGGGTYIVLSALKQIPMGIPKACVSTLAAKDLTRQMESKDIVLIPSIVDVAGLNSISEMIISQAATAISAMANLPVPDAGKSIGRVAISMFGNTTACVDQCTKLLQLEGYEVFAFHANGQGGRTLEALIRENYFDGVLEITTTELADELCGGICSAGPDRLNAAGEMAIPQVVVPGCMDMVNFGPKDTVPEKYRDRQLYSWAPDVTLMRTNKEENMQLGEMLGAKVNQSFGPVVVLLPERGLSQLDDEGKEFYNPEVNQVLFDSIMRKVRKPVSVFEFVGHINEPLFAEIAVNSLVLMMEERGEPNENRDFRIGNYDV
jgi:uncharacterized protein (UPF0261 family)